MNDVLIELANTNDFLIYGKENLSFLIEELLTVLKEKKYEYLSFFQMANYPKTKIILFATREEYDEYLENHIDEKNIVLNYSRIAEHKLPLFLKRSILHNYVSLLYEEVTKYHNKKHLWLEIGLIPILALEKERFENNEVYFRSFYLDRIVRIDKTIPNTSFFLPQKKYEFSSIEGSYDMSYVLVHYLREKKVNLLELLKNEEKINEIEQTLIDDCIHYYNEKYPVKKSFYEIENPNELMDYMDKNILYGWIDKKGNEHQTLEGVHENYLSCSTQDILKYGIGACSEQAKLMKHWFDYKGIENKLFCYRAEQDEYNDDVAMHFLVFYYLDGLWYHIEHSATIQKGIFSFKTLDDALAITQDKFLQEYKDKELIEIPDIPEKVSFEELNQYVDSFKREDGMKR